MTQQTTVKHRINAGRHWRPLLGTALVLWGLTGAAVQADETTLESHLLANELRLSTPLSYNPVVSANGRFVAFTSQAMNLVDHDTNGAYDIFVHDRKTGQTTRVSVDSAGSEGNGATFTSAMSASGRYVVFDSKASNLVATDTNGKADVFLHDRKTGRTTRISVDSAGNEGNGDSFAPAVSADGCVVTFTSTASNLVANDTNGSRDIFLHNCDTGQTSRVSVDSVGNQGNRDSYVSAMSADGRYVAFASSASNLVANDTNHVPDIFVHDRKTGQTSRVSVDSAGNQANGYSQDLSMSADGRYVVFDSFASNLVANDTNNATDIFVHDRKTGQTSQMSVDSAGTEGNSDSSTPAVSADGRYVTFSSSANNLVVNDNNVRLDLFVHDRKTGQTSRVSVDSAGTEGTDDSFDSAVSITGRYVAFDSEASNLVADDTNNAMDIFVHDRKTGQTSRVSVDSAGNQAD